MATVTRHGFVVLNMEGEGVEARLRVELHGFEVTAAPGEDVEPLLRKTARKRIFDAVRVHVREYRFRDTKVTPPKPPVEP